jgi:hypothetical protein
VITAQTSATPTLVFDEVDVGIGGGVARAVGRLLRQLGERGQVLCVTHQAQVASQGHQHFFVSKAGVEGDAARIGTRIRTLTRDEKILEIARMLGGKQKVKASRQNHWRTPKKCSKPESEVLTGLADAVQIEAVISDFEAEFGRDSLLLRLDHFIVKLFHQSALAAHQMVVVLHGAEFEHGMPAFEVMAHHQSGRFELGQHAVDGGQPHIFVGFDQGLVNVLGTEMARLGILQQLQNLDPGKRDFEACFAQFVVLG